MKRQQSGLFRAFVLSSYVYSASRYIATCMRGGGLFDITLVQVTQPLSRTVDIALLTQPCTVFGRRPLYCMYRLYCTA
jgi:hypothetical protein